MTPESTLREPSSLATADTVLVVEDDRDTRELLEYGLRLAGFEVVSCGDVLSARDILARQRPDAVLMDLMLPGEDGMSLCRWLQGNPETADLPHIMYTAHAEPEIRRAAKDEGCDDFLVKPSPILAIVECLRQAIRRRSEK